MNNTHMLLALLAWLPFSLAFLVYVWKTEQKNNTACRGWAARQRAAEKALRDRAG